MSSRRQHWEADFAERARAVWTPEKTLELTGGKELAISPDTAAPLLRALGLLHRDASMPDDRQRKFFQLNHMLRLLKPPLNELAGSGPLQMVDAGCGRSYLTIALAWAAQNTWDIDLHLLGIDRNAKLIDDCVRRAEMSGAQNLAFAAADLNEVDLGDLWQKTWDRPLALDAVIALHACDTATDRAIAFGTNHGAKLIAVAPCCQAELAAGWAANADAESPLAPLHQTPHLRRELAATITDSMRALLLQAAGYEVRVVEFVAAKHTPKNTLIRAVHRTDGDSAARRDYERLKETSGGVGIMLESLIRPTH